MQQVAVLSAKGQCGKPKVVLMHLVLQALQRSTAGGVFGATGVDAPSAVAKSLGIVLLLNSLRMEVRPANLEQVEKLLVATRIRSCATMQLGVLGDNGRSGVIAPKHVVRVGSDDVLDHSSSQRLILYRRCTARTLSYVTKPTLWRTIACRSW